MIKGLSKISLLICGVLGIGAIASIYNITGIFSPLFFTKELSSIFSTFWVLILGILFIILIILIMKKSKYILPLIHITGAFTLLGYYIIETIYYNSGPLGLFIFNLKYSIGFFLIVIILWIGLGVYFAKQKKK